MKTLSLQDRLEGIHIQARALAADANGDLASRFRGRLAETIGREGIEP